MMLATNNGYGLWLNSFFHIVFTAAIKIYIIIIPHCILFTVASMTTTQKLYSCVVKNAALNHLGFLQIFH